ncbi:putative armadillo-like helical protein [Dioscorea sansibarensis]
MLLLNFKMHLHALTILESASFELFFKYVELPNFDIAYNALCTFKKLLTRHETAVSQFLSGHYEQFLSEFLLEPPNLQIMKQYIREVRYLKIMLALLEVFVANPNKPPEIIDILSKNHEALLRQLHNLPTSKGDEDEKFEEERDLIINEITRVSQLSNVVF